MTRTWIARDRHLKRIKMAIIRSLGVGRGRKSAGNLTYRTHRGRTIASEKVGERPKGFMYTAAQEQRKAGFTMINRFARLHGTSINESFTRTKYGSARNAFFRHNYQHLFDALIPLASTPEEANAVSITEIDNAVGEYAVENPETIQRSNIRGQDITYLTGNWDDQANPEPGVPFEVDSMSLGGDALSYFNEDSFREVGGAFVVNDLPLEIKGAQLAGVTVALIAADGTAVDTASWGIQLQNESTIVVIGATASDVDFASVRLTKGTQVRFLNVVA